MAQPATECKLPKFEERDIARVAAHVLGIAGSLLQTSQADSHLDIEVDYSRNGLCLRDSYKQVLDFYALHPGVPSAHFRAVRDKFSDQVECTSTTEYLDRSFTPASYHPVDKETIVLDEDGNIVCVKESKNEAGEITGVETRDATVETILELAKKAAANAHHKTEVEEVGLLGGGINERMYMRQPIVVPLIGRLAVIASETLQAKAPRSAFGVEAELNAGYHRLYGSFKFGYRTKERPSNKIKIEGFNFHTHQNAEFIFEASPLLDSDIATVESSLKVVSWGNKPFATKHVIKQSGDEFTREYRELMEEKGQPRTVGDYPASLETIAQLARTASAVLGASEKQVQGLVEN